MSEIRVNPVTGERVILAPRRALRPSDLSRTLPAKGPLPPSCPFCPGNERETPLEVMARGPQGRPPDGPGWSLRVVPNLYPALDRGAAAGPPEPLDKHGLLKSGPAMGFHEVIIHSPDHHAGLAELDEEGVGLVLDAYRDRILAHRGTPGVRYVQVILNHGEGSGASLAHSHSQVFAIPFVPSRLEAELRRAKEWESRRGGCLFCRLLSEESGGARMVLVEGGFAAFCAFAPRYPFETWLFPRAHSPRFEECGEEELGELGRALKRLLGALRSGLGDPPYNLLLHTAPCRGEARHYHWHLELLPRLSEWGGFELSTDVVICTVAPEDAASLLRSHL